MSVTNTTLQIRESEIRWESERVSYKEEIVKLKEDNHALKYYDHFNLPVGIGLTVASGGSNNESGVMHGDRVDENANPAHISLTVDSNGTTPHHDFDGDRSASNWSYFGLFGRSNRSSNAKGNPSLRVPPKNIILHV